MLISIKKVTKDKMEKQVIREVTISADHIVGIRKWSKGQQDKDIDGDMSFITVSANGLEKKHIIAESEESFKDRLRSIGVQIG